MFFVMDMWDIQTERYKEEHAALARIGACGINSTAARPCTPNGPWKASVEVLKASIVRGPRLELT